MEGTDKTEIMPELKFMERIDTEDDRLKLPTNTNKCSNDGPSPAELLEYCQEIADERQMLVDSDTTNTLWSKIKPYAFAGAGIAGLGAAGYGAYKYWQYMKHQQELQEKLRVEEEKNKLQKQQHELELKRARKQKPVIINNLGGQLPQFSSEDSIWD